MIVDATVQESTPSTFAKTILSLIHGAIAQGVPDDDVKAMLLTQIQDGEEEVNSTEAAKLCGRTPRTLKRWRKAGIGPEWRMSGGRVFYKRRDLEPYYVSRFVPRRTAS